jgi:hypothetical protein
VSTDEEILRAYEAEFAPEPPPRSNRGFWVILAATVAAAVFLIVEILAHQPLNNAIGSAQESLRRSQAVAEAIRSETGAFVGADAEAMMGTLPAMTFRDGSEPSAGIRDVSVSASRDVWAAAVAARPEACFYLRLEIGEDPRYGAGSECTGLAALGAEEPRW